MAQAFGSFLRRRSVNPRTWVKASKAPSRRMVNHSKSSSALSDPFDIIRQTDVPLSSTPSNCFWRDSHDAVCEDVKEWLASLCGLGDESDNLILINKAFPPAISSNSLWTQGRKFPDVSLYGEDELVIQVEVDSGGRETTIFHLIIGLIDQSRYERNYNTTISKTTGFYFPIGEGFIERVDCVWNDEDVQYDVTCTQLELEDAKQLVLEIWGNRTSTSFSGPCTRFTLPMTVSFLRAKFGADSYQLHSGESVVIMCPSRHLVYKFPLGRRAFASLTYFATNLDLQRTAKPRIATSLRGWFEYDAYSPPLSSSNARQYIVPLVETVVEAIKELHGVGSAHLDIRLENICFDGNSRAILIDIDRSCRITDGPSSLYVLYSKSEMYKCPTASWTCENLDWKQFGMLIQELAGSTHDFITKLIHNGELLIL